MDARPVLAIIQPALVLVGHESAANDAKWSPDGRRIASAGRDGIVRVWNASDGLAVLLFSGYTGAVSTVAWSPDGKQLATANSDGIVRVWNAVDGREMWVLTANANWVQELLWSPDGRMLAGVSGATIQFWDVTSGIKAAVLTGHRVSLALIAWSGDGSVFVSCDIRGEIRVWDGVSGDSAAVYEGTPSLVTAFARSPCSKKIASATYDSMVRVLDVVSGRELLAMPGACGALAWSPEGARLAGGGREGAVCVWDAASGVVIATWQPCATLSILAFQWSGDGSMLAMATYDSYIHVWGAADDRTAAVTLHGHTRFISAMNWCPTDSSKMASAGNDGAIRVWDLCELVWKRRVPLLRGVVHPHLLDAVDDVGVPDCSDGGAAHLLRDARLCSVKDSCSATSAVLLGVMCFLLCIQCMSLPLIVFPCDSVMLSCRPCCHPHPFF